MDGNTDWVAQNLQRQRKILEEKQRQKRITSATIRWNKMPCTDVNSMDPTRGYVKLTTIGIVVHIRNG
ncbi:unnamed protein product [Angiostrongylus costaricensis]|uniref:Uncharacterized protein n=1 Tax=Angiostrongylus costaricensis TaxID=334426 RepID=A0A0R3Q158_ANGCS|nr:unnamed protein product [Angiostrongylus costaricensis]